MGTPGADLGGTAREPKAIGEENRERWAGSGVHAPESWRWEPSERRSCDRQIDVRLVLDCGAGRSIPVRYTKR